MDKNNYEKTNQELYVNGRVVISNNISDFSGAVAHITLENISRLDSFSETIVERIYEDIDHQNGETEIVFQLKISDPNHINPKNDYSVRVWIDLDGDGKVGKNDLHSDQTYPVLTRGYKNHVDIFIDS